MNNKDWNFIFGELGNPIADIKDWMLMPYPKWMLNKLKKEYKEYEKSNKKRLPEFFKK